MPPQQSILALCADDGSSFIGYIAADGTAWAGYTESSLDAITWYREYDGAQSISFGFFPWFRIGVLDNGGNYYVKQGGMSSDWVLEASSISQGLLCFASGDFSGGGFGRLGVIDTGGRFSVKEGLLDAPWTLEANGATFGIIDEFRIGFIDRGGNFNVKEGSLDANWTLEATGVLQAGLDGTNLGAEAIGIIDTANNFSMKIGRLDANWVQQPFTNVQQIALAEGMIGVLTSDGTFSIGESPFGESPSPNYYVVATDATYIAVAGRISAYVRRGDGAVLARLDSVGDWTVLPFTAGAPSSGVVTGRSIVDIHGKHERRRRRAT